MKITPGFNSKRLTVIILSSLVLIFYATAKLHSTTQAAIEAESHWSKNQKDSLLSLIFALHLKSQNDFADFYQHLFVISSDYDALSEILKDNPDFKKMDGYFLKANHSPDDIRTMGLLFHYGKDFSLIQKSLQQWKMGSEIMFATKKLAKEAEKKIKEGAYTLQDKENDLQWIKKKARDLSQHELVFNQNIHKIKSLVRNCVYLVFIITIIFYVYIIRRLRKKLIKSENEIMIHVNKLNQVLDGLNKTAIVSVTDEAGNIEEANDNFCQISGYSVEELLGKNHRILNSGHHSNEFFQHLWRTISSGKIWQNEICNKSKSGKTYWVDSSIIPIQDHLGKRKYLSVRYDISEKKKSEVLLLQNEKMKSLGEIAGNIAHEINNPLAIIMGKTDILIDVLDNGQIEKEYFFGCLQKIGNSSSKIKDVIESLKSFSRDGTNDPFTRCSIKKILQKTLTLCGESLSRQDIRLNINMNEIEDLQFECRETQLLQVFTNLISNSVDAISSFEEKWIDITFSSPDIHKLLIISVSDSGQGIPEHVANIMMHPFFTTKELGKGIGLGLSISKDIIESHQGKLYIDKDQPFTTFVIELPITQYQEGG